MKHVSSFDIVALEALLERLVVLEKVTLPELPSFAAAQIIIPLLQQECMRRLIISPHICLHFLASLARTPKWSLSEAEAGKLHCSLGYLKLTISRPFPTLFTAIGALQTLRYLISKPNTSRTHRPIFWMAIHVPASASYPI
ncbi:hypothetical protein K470DRAFT_262824 [Piedraia hortae CBS 480.64]|uniref:Uncharacterized protein n=1 Tax=Piedraia hortae CBS 480.64 TaxID=1314780 RepID=A0A6A7C595_9PEZI|nr:hypothetical protein K470DRAFT_262824 [Piedraia hortae CBS 480.64]